LTVFVQFKIPDRWLVSDMAQTADRWTQSLGKAFLYYSVQNTWNYSTHCPISTCSPRLIPSQSMLDLVMDKVALGQIFLCMLSQAPFWMITSLCVC